MTTLTSGDFTFEFSGEHVTRAPDYTKTFREVMIRHPRIAVGIMVFREPEIGNVVPVANNITIVETDKIGLKSAAIQAWFALPVADRQRAFVEARSAWLTDQMATTERQLALLRSEHSRVQAYLSPTVYELFIHMDSNGYQICSHGSDPTELINMAKFALQSRFGKTDTWIENSRQVTHPLSPRARMTGTPPVDAYITAQGATR